MGKGWNAAVSASSDCLSQGCYQVQPPTGLGHISKKDGSYQVNRKEVSKIVP